MKSFMLCFGLAFQPKCNAFVGRVSPVRETTTFIQMSETSRRKFMNGVAGGLLSSEFIFWPDVTLADENGGTLTAKVTDKIYFDIKGLNSLGEDGGGPTTSRIVIGLFGEDAPQSTSILKQLASSEGLPAKCKPRETRTLEREQLEANKVYNACIESETKGVTYDLSQIWRVVQNQRIDVGSVSGKYIAREYPTFDDMNSLRHDIPGTVSVRRGNDGGFGFVIFPGGGEPTSDLNSSNVVVGRVLEGMDVVQQLNEVPVVQSAKVNYKVLAGGDQLRAAPSRACRYGTGNLYCNEFKPLKKLLITKTGVV